LLKRPFFFLPPCPPPTVALLIQGPPMSTHCSTTPCVFHFPPFPAPLTADGSTYHCWAGAYLVISSCPQEQFPSHPPICSLSSPPHQCVRLCTGRVVGEYFSLFNSHLNKKLQPMGIKGLFKWVVAPLKFFFIVSWSTLFQLFRYCLFFGPVDLIFYEQRRKPYLPTDC